ncbi:MAG TPA: twin transmembrane helix small protein [Dongiaceae bacterium]|nr:twin transmembrane helix small protein [Dongiaceae bacterium]
MRMFFWILMAVFMAATLATLLVGVVGMGKGGPFNDKYGNKLMRLRVILQGLAIACFVLGWISG